MNSSLRLGLLATVGILSGPVAAQTTTVSLSATKDNTLHDGSNGMTSNGVGIAFFAGRLSSSPTRRAVLAFDIANQIPPGAVVNSVSLRLRMNRTIAGPFLMDLYRLTSDWGEGTSATNKGQGAPATTNDATWEHTFYPSEFWTTQGGDFVATSSAQTLVAGDGFYTWTSPALATDVQGWLDDPGTDFGWILIGDESTTPTVKRFASREAVNSANRPALMVNYSTPPTCSVNPPGPLTVTVGMALTFTVTAQDADPGDIVTLSVTGLPAGATLTPALPQTGNQVSATFNWTPSSAVIASQTIDFQVEDSTGLITNCPVDIEIAECFLVLGPSGGSAAFSGGGHTWHTQLSRVDYFYPISLSEIPAFGVPTAALSRGKLRRMRAPLQSFSAQVLMWNPEFFPANPAQWSRVIGVTVWNDGSVTSNFSGTHNGMGIGNELFTKNGVRMIRFPFSIVGF